MVFERIFIIPIRRQIDNYSGRQSPVDKGDLQEIASAKIINCFNCMESQTQKHDDSSHHIEVAVVTTSGSWPEEGFDKVPVHQAVKHQLEKAAKKLHIADTTNWVALVAGKKLDIEKNYLENNLSTQVTIDYGPSEGGGGNA